MENKSNNQELINTDQFTCDICGEEFDTVSELEEHKKRHNRPSLGLQDEEREFRGDIGAAGMPTSPVQ